MMNRASLLAALLTIGCAPAHPRDVPPDAVLVPRGRSDAFSLVWVSCKPSLGERREFACSIYEKAGGKPQKEGAYRLALAYVPAPGERLPAPPPSLEIAAYDGFAIHVQEPWLLLPPMPMPQPPVQWDPPPRSAPASAPSTTEKVPS